VALSLVLAVGNIMKTHVLVALAVGLVVGIALPLLLRQGEARGQPPQAAAAASSEYKVVEFGTGVQNTETAADMTKKLNDLSHDGWEYVGMVATKENDDVRFLKGYVAFKRPRK
jgi:Domain of unknown function (DUF4177)